MASGCGSMSWDCGVFDTAFNTMELSGDDATGALRVDAGTGDGGGPGGAAAGATQCRTYSLVVLGGRVCRIKL